MTTHHSPKKVCLNVHQKPTEPQESQPRRILVASNCLLENKRFYVENIWREAREANENILSRTGWIEALTLIYEYDGLLFYQGGYPYNIPVIEDIFEPTENHWMSEFLRCDGTGEKPKRFARKLERLRMIELYCRLRIDFRWNGLP